MSQDGATHRSGAQPDKAAGEGAGPAQKRRAWLGLVLLAVASGLICGLQHILIPLATEGQYRPFAAVNTIALTFDETTAYAPRVREALDGHLLSGNPHGLEHKECRYTAVPHLVPTVLVAALAWVLGGSVPNAFIVADFIFPPFAIIVAYLVARRLSASHATALCASALAVLGKGLIHLPRDLIKQPGGTLVGTVAGLQSPEPVRTARTPVPEITEPLLFLAILAFCYLLLDKDRRWIAGAAALGALAFYTYAYSWPFLVVGCLGAAVWMTLRGEKASATLGIGALGLMILLGLPALVSLLLGAQEMGADALARWGLGRDQGPWRVHWYRLLVTLLVALVYPRDRREYPIVVSFCIAPLVCIALRRITGTAMEEWHWIRCDWAPWTLLVLPVLVEKRWWRFAARRRWVFSALAVLLVIYAANRHARWALSEVPRHTLHPDRQHALRWLEDNAPPDAVVMGCDLDMLALIPVYTSCNLYTPYAFMTPATNSELFQRFGHASYFCGLDPDEMLASFIPLAEGRGSRMYAWILHGDRARRMNGCRPLPGDRSVMLQAWQQARDAAAPGGLPFQVSYLWVRLHRVKPDRLADGWQEVWRGSEFAVYAALPSARKTRDSHLFPPGFGPFGPVCAIGNR